MRNEMPQGWNYETPHVDSFKSEGDASPAGTSDGREERETESPEAHHRHELDTRQPILSHRQLEVAYRYISEDLPLSKLIEDPEFTEESTESDRIWFKEFAYQSYDLNNTQKIEYFILNCCQRMVRFHAMRFSMSGLSIDELLQAGNIGLMEAVHNYPLYPARDFVKCAHASIKNEIKLTIMNEVGAFRLPWYLNAALKRLNTSINSFTLKNQRFPSPSEVESLAGQLDLDDLPTNHRHVLEAYRLSTTSFDKELQTDTSLRDIIPSPDNFEESILQLSGGDLDFLLNRLSEKQLQVLSMRYGLNGTPIHSIAEVGQKLKVSEITVTRIARAALQLLRETVDDDSHVAMKIETFYPTLKNEEHKQTPRDSITISERITALSALPHEINPSGIVHRLTTEECSLLDTHAEALWRENENLTIAEVATLLKQPTNRIIASRRRLKKSGKVSS